MYLIMKLVFLGLLVFSCSTKGQESSPDEGEKKLIKMLGHAHERILNLEARVDELNPKTLTNKETGARALNGPYKTGYKNGNLEQHKTYVCYFSLKAQDYISTSKKVSN